MVCGAARGGEEQESERKGRGERMMRSTTSMKFNSDCCNERKHTSFAFFFGKKKKVSCVRSSYYRGSLERVLRHFFEFGFGALEGRMEGRMKGRMKGMRRGWPQANNGAASNQQRPYICKSGRAIHVSAMTVINSNRMLNVLNLFLLGRLNLVPPFFLFLRSSASSFVSFLFVFSILLQSSCSGAF